MKIGIIAHIDHGRHTVVNAPTHNINSIVQNNVEAKSYIDFSEPIEYARVPIPDIFKGKQFICKGKHQYREAGVKVDDTYISKWICQCGRIIK